MLVLIDFLLDYFPPKAKVTGSNPVGCTNFFNNLAYFSLNLRSDSKHIVTTASSSLCLIREAMLGQSTSEYAYSPLRKASVRRGRTSGDIAAEVVREAEKAGGEISVLSRC
jgi:hypothetical protein